MFDVVQQRQQTTNANNIRWLLCYEPHFDSTATHTNENQQTDGKSTNEQKQITNETITIHTALSRPCSRIAITSANRSRSSLIDDNNVDDDGCCCCDCETIKFSTCTANSVWPNACRYVATKACVCVCDVTNANDNENIEIEATKNETKTNDNKANYLFLIEKISMMQPQGWLIG